MTAGPGKYDDQATAVRLATGADTVLVLVIGGDRGEGFSVQTRDPTMAREVPNILRTLAAAIEAGQP